MQFMITNNGPHPADKWAQITTSAILDLIQIDAQSHSPQAIEARLAKEDLRPKLLRHFTDHHGAVQTDERKKARKVGATCDPSAHLEDIHSCVDELFAGTPFAEHAKNADFIETVRRIVGQHSANVMDIERRYHADRKQKVA